MDRREFLRTSAAALALSALNNYTPAFAGEKAKRVGLIGCGWYGKCDLFRLIQVAPVEVVSLCDVDKRMLAEAAEMVAVRQASQKKPRLYGDYREMLKEKDLDIVLVATPDHWHALPMIAAVRGGGRRLRAEADQRGRGRGPGDARGRPQAQARRAGRHAAPQHAAPHRGPRHASSKTASSAGSGWSRSTATTTCVPAAIRPTRDPARLSRLRDVDRAGADASLQRPGPSADAGGPSWSTATASSATCASTCST